MEVHVRRKVGCGGAIAAETEITVRLSVSTSATVKLLDIFEQNVSFASHVSSDRSEGSSFPKPSREVFCAST